MQKGVSAKRDQAVGGVQQRLDSVAAMVKAAAAICGSLGALAFLGLQFGPAHEAAQSLLSRAGAVTEISWAGAVVKLGEGEALAALKPHLDGTQPAAELSRQAASAIAQIRPEEFDRLMQIGLLDNLCEFQRPTPQMRADVATDYALQEKRLASVIPSAEVFEAVSSAARYRNAAAPFAAAPGAPLACYVLSLTDLGRNVKTVLVQSMKTSFGGRWAPESSKAPASGEKVAGL